ncbi:hypothetical protein P692DRAFT_20129149 [Suillus brevipes Sb2]|nr:hypothetical protein P692DRAFT_20129149 [Suillus brevipes Sb2]
MQSFATMRLGEFLFAVPHLHMASAKSVFIFFSGLVQALRCVSHRGVPSLSRQCNGSGRPARTTSHQWRIVSSPRTHLFFSIAPNEQRPPPHDQAKPAPPL